jgi:hypothetical protein
MALSAPTRDIGVVDTLQYGALLSDWLEFVPDLQWPASVQTYSRMRHDPKLAAILAAYSLPIRRATWCVDPAGCRDEVVQLVADDLGLPIKGVDAEPSGARRRGVMWGEHLRHALLSLVHGFMPFERRYEIRNSQARLINLGERMPHTIGEITVNKDGTVASISQDVVGAQDIPAGRLVWYAHEREGANWTGRSLLRPAYGAWLLKHEVWRVHATSIRRFGMGVPSVEAPPGATPGQVIEAQRLASAIRVGDQSGAGMPPGFKLALTGMTGSVPDAMAFIQYLDQQMSTMALAGLLDLGQTATGSRALGQSFLDLLWVSVAAVADDIARVATSGHGGMPGIVTQLVDFNWGEDEPAPSIVAADVGEQHEVTAEAIQMLVTCGALQPDAELDAYIRQAWRLPERDPATPPPAPAPAPVQARVDGRKLRAAVRGERVRAASQRPLTDAETQSGMDPQAIQEEWQTALDGLLAAWPPIAAAWLAELADQIAQAVDAGDPAALGALTVDSSDAAQQVTATMTALAATAAGQMADEAASQGVAVEEQDPNEDHLAAIAAAVVALLALGLAAAAGREALRRMLPGADGRTVADQVTAHLEGLSDSSLRTQLGGALSAAQGAGRLAVLQAAPPARYISTEVLDTATCTPCRDADGTEWTDLDEALAHYPVVVGYVDCLGGVRCRGQLIAIWDEA